MLNNMALRRSAEGRGLMRCLCSRARPKRFAGSATPQCCERGLQPRRGPGAAGPVGRSVATAPEHAPVARAVGDEDLVALVRKEMGRAQSRAGDVAAGLILLEEARTELTRLREPQEVVDADIASAEAHLLGGRPERALVLIEER